MAKARIEASFDELFPKSSKHQCSKPDAYAAGRPYMFRCIECGQLWQIRYCAGINSYNSYYEKTRWFQFRKKRAWKIAGL